MTHSNCTCNPPAILSSIDGKRCHVINERGEWCAIVNQDGVYLQNLIIASPEEMRREQDHQQKILEEQSVFDSKEARKQELKSKLDNNEILSLQELTELLKLAL